MESPSESIRWSNTGHDAYCITSAVQEYPRFRISSSSRPEGLCVLPNNFRAFWRCFCAMIGCCRTAGECARQPREGADGTAQVIERTTRGESLCTDRTQAVHTDLLRLVDCRRQ